MVVYVVRALLISSALLGVGLLFARLIRTPPETAPLQPEKINLALRRTAHDLLRASGDSTSRIPAVQVVDAYTYRLSLPSGFEYDRLPRLLQTSLAAYRIDTEYAVAVTDCATRTIQLGYSAADLLRKEGVPCTGRALAAGCYALQLTFAKPTGPALPTPLFALAGLLCAGLLALGWRWAGAKPTNNVPDTARHVPDDASATYLRFGQSVLNVPGLTLTAGPQTHTLTYREAKLLRVLAQHPNTVLPREQILKLVWEDEGVTVGRSVDVFVSRLRKLLTADTTVRIAAVHGVGYRLEVLRG
jgi:hypothetical protein